MSYQKNHDMLCKFGRSDCTPPPGNFGNNLSAQGEGEGGGWDKKKIHIITLEYWPKVS